MNFPGRSVRSRTLPLALAALLTGMALAAGAQQTARPQMPIIRASTTLVDVPVLVLNKSGQPMEQLSQPNFKVLDNGQSQEITGFDSQPRPLSLAIVVDTSDWDAIGQAKRSAHLLTDMVVGAQGVASVFIPGPEPKQLLPFTSDTAKIADVLMHLTKSPTAPRGEGSVTEPLNLAVMALRHQPPGRTRAALVISNASTRGGEQAQALLESDMSQAIPIFRLAPNRPAGAPDHINPVSTSSGGTGQGSQRVQAPPSPVDSHGMPTSSAGATNLNLAPIIGGVAGLAGKVLAPHHMDYVYNSGGLDYSPGNDHQFDQKLSLIGEELRAIYHLYYAPNDLGVQPALHEITVQLDLPATADIGKTSYRHSYLGMQVH
ncbi:MAG: hypothetical protein ACRD1A_06820 [Terriglobales bacterium]